MCLNASLAGLVAITAPCDVTDAAGSLVIGAVAGLLVVFGVWLLDYKLHVDDPVGAVAVHFMNGIWGTFAVGLFATNTAPGYAIADKNGNELVGLFYGGGVKLLGLQCLGIITVLAWAAVIITITFLVIRCNNRSSCQRRRRNHWSGSDRTWSCKRLCRLCINIQYQQLLICYSG